jgi:hypothetical protein
MRATSDAGICVLGSRSEDHIATSSGSHLIKERRIVVAAAGAIDPP